MGFMIPWFALPAYPIPLAQPRSSQTDKASSRPKSRDDGGHPPLWLAASPPLVKATVVFRSEFSS